MVPQEAFYTPSVEEATQNPEYYEGYGDGEFRASHMTWPAQPIKDYPAWRAYVEQFYKAASNLGVVSNYNSNYNTGYDDAWADAGNWLYWYDPNSPHNKVVEDVRR